MPTSTSLSVLLAVAAAALGTLPRAAVGHGFMSFPIARNWQGRIDGKEYNPHGFQGGGPDTIKGRQAALGLGIGTEWLPNSEETVETAPRHPLCGDRAPAGEPYLAPQTPTTTFQPGSEVEFELVITTHHRGHFEFALCDLSTTGGVLTQECLNTNKLVRSSAPGQLSPVDPNYPARYYMEPPSIDGDLGTSSWDRHPGTVDGSVEHAKSWFGSALKIRTKYRLPEGLVCEHCVLQWWWVTANTCYASGYREYGWPDQSWWKGPTMSDCGTSSWPEEFWNCADVRISGTPAPPAPPSPSPAPSPSPSPAPPTPDGEGGNGAPAEDCGPESFPAERWSAVEESWDSGCNLNLKVTAPAAASSWKVVITTSHPIGTASPWDSDFADVTSTAGGAGGAAYSYAFSSKAWNGAVAAGDEVQVGATLQVGSGGNCVQVQTVAFNGVRLLKVGAADPPPCPTGATTTAAPPLDQCAAGSPACGGIAGRQLRGRRTATPDATNNNGEGGDGDGDGKGDGGVWNIAALEASAAGKDTAALRRDGCFIGLFAGDACGSAGQVYKIEPFWLDNHYGGSFGVEGHATCGTVVTNWLAINSGHNGFVGMLEAGDDITLLSGDHNVLATAVAPFDCAGAGGDNSGGGTGGGDTNEEEEEEEEEQEQEEDPAGVDPLFGVGAMAWDGSFKKFASGEQDFCASCGFGSTGCSYVCAGGGNGASGGSCDPTACSSGQYSFPSGGEGDGDRWDIVASGAQASGASPYRAFAYLPFGSGGDGWQAGVERTLEFTMQIDGATDWAAYVKLLFWTDGGNILGFLPPSAPAASTTGGGNPFSATQLIAFPNGDYPNGYGAGMDLVEGHRYVVRVGFTPAVSGGLDVAVRIDGAVLGTGNIGVSPQGAGGNGPQLGIYSFDFNRAVPTATQLKLSLGRVALRD